MDQKSPLKVRENKGPTHTLTVLGCLQTGPQVLDSGSNAVLSHHPDSLSPGLPSSQRRRGRGWAKMVPGNEAAQRDAESGEGPLTLLTVTTRPPQTSLPLTSATGLLTQSPGV